MQHHGRPAGGVLMRLALAALLATLAARPACAGPAAVGTFPNPGVTVTNLTSSSADYQISVRLGRGTLHSSCQPARWARWPACTLHEACSACLLCAAVGAPQWGLRKQAGQPLPANLEMST